MWYLNEIFILSKLMKEFILGKFEFGDGIKDKDI